MSSPRQFKFLLLLLLLACFTLEPAATVIARPITDRVKLDEIAAVFEQVFLSGRGPAYQRLLESTNPAQMALNADRNIELMAVDERGRPHYYVMENLNAAKTVSTNKVWPGGGHGYSLTGSGTTLGKLGLWDGGGVLTTHQELTGRVTQMDSPIGTNSHSTHVAGTMIATGVSANAKGMSYQANLAAYEWGNDLSEMASAASGGMRVSSHSYGFVTGWYQSGDWYWFGDTGISAVEDYYFGFYDDDAQDWDNVAYNAPYYTIAKSAGNDRDDYPGAGVGHWVWNNVLGDWEWSTDTRDPDGGTDGYDCIAHSALAKNIITVGAVNDIPSGYSAPGDVVMSIFSGWGPTDDGRIKPDLVANGIGLYSCTNTSNSSYATSSGTSMSTPNLSGSVNLLVRHYEDTHGGGSPLSSTVKAILVQTADEAGANLGPDYKFGWGLLNTLKAAMVMTEDTSDVFHITEDYLSNGDIDTLFLASDGLDSLRLTLAWTDPPGTPESPSLNPTTSMLVNDLDLRLQYLDIPVTYYPYVLNPSSPGDAASTGDNTRDNVEQVYVPAPMAGDYMVTVRHKGTLASNQWYSLVSSEKLTTEGPDLQPPSVTVVQPNGGEMLQGETEYEIRWIATDAEGVNSVSIYLSTNGGASFPYPIATGEPNDSSYVWEVYPIYSGNCRVKVIAYDPSMNAGEDQSDANFSIVESLPEVPALSRKAEVILAVLVLLAGVVLLVWRKRRLQNVAE